ncbi:MAG: ABC transporter ATP-binding protein, partial [Alphaproteobacteria bacterium]|nr:ABC transporter ATP-binding protein [Alphaproteobacteria bacterium]
NIEKLEEEIAYAENRRADHDLYTKDAELFDSLTKGLARSRAELSAAEDRWLELEELKASVSAPA